MAFSPKYPTPKPFSVLTPVGTAAFCAVTQPSTKFNPDGVYSVKVIIPRSDVQPLLDRIDALQAEASKMIQAQIKKKVNSASPCYVDQVDDQGNETGNVILNFKLKAKSSKKPQLVDAHKKPSTANVFSGSKIRVAGLATAWFVPALGVGVSLKLSAVQIIELVTGGSYVAGADAFDEMDGYSAADEEPVVFTEQTEAPTVPITTAKVDASAF